MPVKRWSLERLRAESSYWRSCILVTAAHLDLFAWIGKRAKRPTEFVAHFGGSPEDWEIFLNALCAMGLLRKRGARYSNSPFSARHLADSSAPFLLTEYDGWKIWGGLASALLSGKRPDIHKPFFSHRQKTRRLLDALYIDGLEIAPELLVKLPLRDAATLLDLGGGLGAFSIVFCRRYPRLQVTLVEHPRIVPLARRAVAEAGLTKRVRVLGLDFAREALPRGFDTVFLSNVIHSQSVDENRSLFLKIRDCLKPQGRLILRDVFMNQDRTAPVWATLFSVSLLLHTPRGRCYSLDEVLGWLRQARFSRIGRLFRSSRVPFDPDSVLIARK
jgi:SAM-dependent methyltransferase